MELKYHALHSTQEEEANHFRPGRRSAAYRLTQDGCSLFALAAGADYGWLNESGRCPFACFDLRDCMDGRQRAGGRIQSERCCDNEIGGGFSFAYQPARARKISLPAPAPVQ